MFEKNKPIFIVSYSSVHPTCIGTSYRTMAGSRLARFEIIRLDIEDHKKVYGKYHKVENLDESQARNGYVLKDQNGDIWNIQLPYAELSDLGRSDYVAKRVTGLPSSEHGQAGIELSYHLNELSVARSGVNTDGYQLTINQKTLIKEFETQYPGWRIDIGHAREEVNEKLILNHLNYHRFTITQRDLFA